MKSGALIIGTVVSLVLLAVAGALYAIAQSGDDSKYRASIDLVRESQQLSSDWGMEVSRVKSDPLTDFDSLAAFIPRMARVKEGLASSARLIPDLPERLSHDIDAYINAIEAREESIERFKTGYAVVRNSSRYMPLAAVNVARQAEDGGEPELARRVSTLIRDINLYLPTPTDTAQTRLMAEVNSLHQESVSYPPALANALANLLSHAEVLVARQGPTEELFRRATSNDVSETADQLIGRLEFELGKKLVLARYYEIGILATFGVLALFWIMLGVQQRARAGAAAAVAAAAPAQVMPAETSAQPPPDVDDQPVAGARTAEAPRAAEAALEPAEAPPAPADAPPELPEIPPVHTAVPARAAAEPPARVAEAIISQEFIIGCVADALAQAASHIQGRMDYLRQTQRRIQDALQNDDVMSDMYNESEIDNEIDAISAIASSVRQEAGSIAELGRRLETYSDNGPPRDGFDSSMLDINACIDEAIAATGAESEATIVKSLADIPEIFAVKTEFLLLLTKVIENSVQAVQELSSRKGVIKISTAQKGNEIQITVIDNGDGVVPEKRANIFKPFYTSRDGAMGVGLALSGHLVKKYEGTIKVNSLPGQGTVAQISVPAGIPAP